MRSLIAMHTRATHQDYKLAAKTLLAEVAAF